MTRLILSVFLLAVVITTNAQEEKEKFALPIEVGQGFQDTSPSLSYLASFSLAPMAGLQINSMNKVRVGGVANMYYTNTGWDASFGPRVAYRLNKTGELGNVFNFWLFGEATWSKEKRNLYGGGLTVALNPLEITLHPQYEFYNQEFWFATKVGVNLGIFFKKETNDPLGN